MNAGEVVKLLEKEGVKRTEANIKYLASKYDLYLCKTDLTPRPGLDPKKVKKLVKVLSSELLLSNIAHTLNVPLSQVVYYSNKPHVHVVTQYGRKLLNNRKELEYVKSKLQK